MDKTTTIPKIPHDADGHQSHMLPKLLPHQESNQYCSPLVTVQNSMS